MSKIVVIGLSFLFFISACSSSYGINLEKKFHSATLVENILFVGGDGAGNYTKIQDAIDDSNEGDTVFVYSGVYFEYITINKSINLIGEEKNTTKIDGSNLSKIVISIFSEGTSINGFKIKNYGKEAIFIQANNTIVTNNIIGPQLQGWSGGGIRLYKANNNSIIANEISGVFNAVEIVDSDYNLIINNSINSSYLYGIWISTSTNNKILSNTIDTGSPVGIPGSYIGIRLTESSHNNIANNILISRNENCCNGLKLWDSFNNNLEENNFENCGLNWHGYFNNNVKYNLVNKKPLLFLINQSNLVIDNAGQVFLFNCRNVRLNNLTIIKTPIAIDLFLSQDCEIKNVTCIDNEYGIRLKKSKDNLISENKLINNEYGIYVDDGSSNTVISKNIVEENCYIGIYSTAPCVTITQNKIFENSCGIMCNGFFAIKATIKLNTISNNWFGISLSSKFSLVKNNLIEKNFQGIYLSGSADWNMIKSNHIFDNIHGINITYEPQSFKSNSNWILKNNFVNNTEHARFDTSFCNHWISNYWQGNIFPPYQIEGRISFYKIHPWSGGIVWEKHFSWFDFDWVPSLIQYDILI